MGVGGGGPANFAVAVRARAGRRGTVRFYVVILAAIVLPIVAAVMAHRVDKDDAKLRAMKNAGAGEYERITATTNPADRLRGIREENQRMAEQFRKINDR